MISFSVATQNQHDEIYALYEECGYHGGIQPNDFILVAQEFGRLVGAVRLCVEQGLTLLRGFFILSSHQGKGIGSQMLQELISHVGNRTCYCIPFDHLTKFYGAAGFVPLSPTDAPIFLAQRFASYSTDGHKVILMVRPCAA